jgi:hypothetical protein
MANVSYANNALDKQNVNRKFNDEPDLDKYSESYWAEVI